MERDESMVPLCFFFAAHPPCPQPCPSCKVSDLFLGLGGQEKAKPSSVPGDGLPAGGKDRGITAPGHQPLAFSLFRRGLLPQCKHRTFPKDKKEGCEGSSDLTQKSSRKKQCLSPQQPAKETSWAQPRKAQELFPSYFGKTPARHGCSHRPKGLDSFVQETTGNNPAPQTPAQTQGSPLTSPGKPYMSNAIFPVKKE